MGSSAARVQKSPRARGEDALHAVQHVDECNESDDEHSTQLRGTGVRDEVYKITNASSAMHRAQINIKYEIHL